MHVGAALSPEIYRSTGSSQVPPELVKSLDLPNVRGIQFMPNGIVRVTYKESAQCDAAVAGGVRFRGASLRVAPVDSRTRLVYVRDLPVEVPDNGLKVYLRAFGVVHSVLAQTYPGMPHVYTGTHVVKVIMSKDLPSSARISGFDVRLWYQGQPRACPVCRSHGHRVKDCPFNGVCRRCRQPGHMARDCPSRRSSVVPAPDPPPSPDESSVSDAPPVPDSVPFMSDPSADPRMSEDEDADDPDHVLSSASESGEAAQSSTAILFSRKRSFSESDASSFVLLDEEESTSAVDPVSGKPEIASAVSTPAADVPVAPDVPGTPASASAGPISAFPVVAVTPVLDGTPESASAVKSEPSARPS